MTIVLHEVGLRDGLQIEKQVVPTEQKIQWAEALMASGMDVIQLGSFVLGVEGRGPAEGFEGRGHAPVILDLIICVKRHGHRLRV